MVYYHFQRVEEKYLLTKMQKDLLFEAIKEKLEKDEFYESEIHSIYFDNDNHDLIINSLEKPVFKDKYRVRSYGLPDKNGEVFLEMKTKYKGVVGKRRIKLSLDEYHKFLNGTLNKSDQIYKELAYYKDFYNLKPAIYIAYDRKSYKSIEDNNLRITFDTNIRSRWDNLDFIDGDFTQYFDEEKYIMEIKTLGAMPLWLVRAMSKLDIKPTSFSKYGKIYEKKLKEDLLYV